MYDKALPGGASVAGAVVTGTLAKTGVDLFVVAMVAIASIMVGVLLLRLAPKRQR